MGFINEIFLKSSRNKKDDFLKQQSLKNIYLLVVGGLINCAKDTVMNMG